MAFTFPLDSAARAGAVVSIFEDSAFAVPTVDIIGAHRQVTLTPLGANATYTSPTRDRLSGGLLEARVRYYVDTDQASAASGVIVEESHDGTSWATVGTAQTSVANNLLDTGWRTISRRYHRFRYINGATAQARFLVYEIRDTTIDDVALSGGSTTISSGSVNVRSVANFIGAPLTSTNLAAGATYTSGGLDSNDFTRLRIMVAHTAGNVAGHLAIQQSTDNTTFRETHRLPIPSDGLYRTFDFGLVARYARVLFVNGGTAQTLNFIAARLVGPEAGMQDPDVLPFLETTTAPLAAATVTGTTLDMGPKAHYTRHRAGVFSDQVGTLQLQQSRDGAVWRTVSSVATTANTYAQVTADVHMRFLRTVFVNGATASTAFELTTSLGA